MTTMFNERILFDPSASKPFAHDLLRSLGAELFQTESSAVQHCRREAARVGSSPPQRALLAVAEHAELVLRELESFGPAHGMPTTQRGKRLGALFSLAREWVGDRILHSERSYRFTLLGIRHGLDLVNMLRYLATDIGDLELVGFCDRWLRKRSELALAVEDQLGWFSRHPELALKPAKAIPGISRMTRRAAS